MKKKALGCAAFLVLMALACPGCGKEKDRAAMADGVAVTVKEEIAADRAAAGEEVTGSSVVKTAGEETAAGGIEGKTAGEETVAGRIEGETAGQESQREDGKEEKLRKRPKVRGIYVTGAMAGTANMDNLIDLVDRTELNAMVIDIKNDEGYVVCDMDVPLVQEIGSVKRYVKDMPALIRKCKEKDIYLIARIVSFKDPILAEAKPDWSLHNADGSVFRDKSGLAWVNPYEKQMWDYLLQIAEGAADLGFDEVQFDYIRFSTDKGMKQVDFGEETRSREEAITEFTAYAADALHEKGIAVSADVYGVVIDSEVDQEIVGQNYVDMAEHLDYLSPMVYPSHYGADNYNIPIPDAQPYDTVLAAMQASKKVLAGVTLSPEEISVGKKGTDSTPGNGAAAGTDSVSGNGISAGTDSISGNDASAGADSHLDDDAAGWSKEEIAALKPLAGVRADVRPWLQDFTATWVKGHISYGPEQIREQIQAVYDAGYEEWILWNAANRYTEGGLNAAGPKDAAEEESAAVAERETAEEDDAVSGEE